MGQFDSETDAALAQLGWEKLSETPGAEFQELVGDLLSLVGTTNPFGLTGKISSLLLKIRRLVGASYADNLIYVISAVRNDLNWLYKKCETLRSRIEALPSDPRFAAAISAVALRAMHTSVESRLKRLARIVVNGVKEDDLEPELLDDMLRAASELTERDIEILTKVSKTQRSITIYNTSTNDGTINLPRELWRALELEKFISLDTQMPIRSSLARLQSLGFGADIQTMESMWIPRFVVTPEGEKFLQRLRDVAE